MIFVIFVKHFVPFVFVFVLPLRTQREEQVLSASMRGTHEH